MTVGPALETPMATSRNAAVTVTATADVTGEGLVLLRAEVASRLVIAAWQSVRAVLVRMAKSRPRSVAVGTLRLVHSGWGNSL